mgnify:CR=1 FL=1
MDAAKLLKHMAWANKEILTKVSALPDSALDAYVVNPEWTVREISRHIASSATWYGWRLLDRSAFTDAENAAWQSKLEETGQFDVIGDFAEPLPVKVIAALLGFPDEDEHLLRPWSQAIVKMYEVSPSESDKVEAVKASEEFAEYVHGLMLERKRNPGTDLITDLALVEEDGEKLNAHELIATCVLLLNAGHEASVNGFGNGMVATLKNPQQLELLKSKPDELAATAVDEFLRFDAPLHLFERTATEDTEVGGVKIEAGQKIAALLGSAGRDETVFDNPDQLDLTRDPNPHIGFGAGIHFCIGAPLARMEMTTSLPALIKRYPKLELAAEPVRRPTFVLRGYESVFVTA